MRYSLVLATLAASAIATPYINVEVSEPEAVVEITNNNNDHHHRVGHGHHGSRNRHHRGWFSSLFGRNDEDDEDERRRRGRNDRGHNDRGRNDRGRNDRGRNGRRGRDSRRDDDWSDNDDDEFHTSILIEDISQNNYECNIQAKSTSVEKKVAKECCQQVEGKLYDVPGRCVIRNVEQDPSDQWKNCASQNQVDFAECYKREQREVDDELDDENRHRHRSEVSNSEQRDNRRNGRNGRDDRRDGRNGRDGRDGRNGRDGRRNGRNGRDDRRDGGEGRRHRDQSVLGNRDDRDDRRRHPDEQYECRVKLDNEDVERHITAQCCFRPDVQGELDNNGERCELRQGHDADRFEECAIRYGRIREEDVQCRRTNNRRDL